MILSREHPVVCPKALLIYRLRSFCQKCSAKKPCCSRRNRFLKKHPDMRSFSRTRTLCQDIHFINPANLAQSIYFFPPEFICIGIIIPIRSIIMIVKIKYKEIASFIRQHRVDAYHVRTVFSCTCQMLHDHFACKLFVMLFRAVRTFYFLFFIFRTNTRLPVIPALRIISCFPGLRIRLSCSFTVYIFPSFEKRIEILGVLLSDRFRDDKLLPDCFRFTHDRILLQSSRSFLFLNTFSIGNTCLGQK